MDRKETQGLILTTSQIYMVKRFGIKQEPIVVIDDFTAQPEKLIEVAKSSQFHKDSKHYPGFRSEAYSGYLLENFELLMRIFENVYGIRSVMTVQESNYCLLTTHPKYLSFVQSYPQFNGLDHDSISAVHFFCNDEQGELAFYRHRATGFEFVDKERLKIYGQVRSTDFRQLGALTGNYMHQSNRQFDVIGRIPAKFNRLVLFRSYNLHMELPGEKTILLNDRNNGRLTINSIFGSKPPLPMTELNITEEPKPETDEKAVSEAPESSSAHKQTFRL